MGVREANTVIQKETLSRCIVVALERPRLRGFSLALRRLTLAQRSGPQGHSRERSGTHRSGPMGHSQDRSVPTGHSRYRSGPNGCCPAPRTTLSDQPNPGRPQRTWMWVSRARSATIGPKGSLARSIGPKRSLPILIGPQRLLHDARSDPFGPTEPGAASAHLDVGDRERTVPIGPKRSLARSIGPKRSLPISNGPKRLLHNTRSDPFGPTEPRRPQRTWMWVTGSVESAEKSRLEGS
jgi:hypothetical protein